MLQNGACIMLCRSHTDDGRPFFHYIKAKRKIVERMHEDYDLGKHVDFAAYGEIVYSGWGENPTPEEEAAIKKKLGKHFKT